MRLFLAICVPVLLALWLGSCGPLDSDSKTHVTVQANDAPGGEAAEQESARQDEPLRLADEPALLLDDEPPLLLDDGEDEDPPEGPVADNSRCFVCHINYAQEEIAVTHARANLGCANCHGPSDAHIADESWASGGNGTAPDIMYPRAKIIASCMACHPKETIDTPQHAPVFADSDEKKVCTDCHGDHRLPQRRCKWK